MSTFGIKGSRRGVAVQDALPYQLNYDSDKNTWKYFQKYSGSLTIELDAVPPDDEYKIQTIDIEHNLGYTPQQIGSFEVNLDPGEYRTLPGRRGFIIKGVLIPENIVEAGYIPGENTSTLWFQFIKSGGAWEAPVDEVTIKYVTYILVESEFEPWYE